MKKLTAVFLIVILALTGVSGLAVDGSRFEQLPGNAIRDNGVFYGFDDEQDGLQLRMAYVDLGAEDASCPVLMLYWSCDGISPDSLLLHAGDKSYTVAGCDVSLLAEELQVKKAVAFIVDESAAVMLRKTLSAEDAVVCLKEGEKTAEYTLTGAQKEQLAAVLGAYDEELLPAYPKNTLLRLADAALCAQITAADRIAATPAPTPDPEYPTLQTGSEGAAVKKLQEYLSALGYLSGSADGDYGKKTARAVSAFQKDAGLEETGVADGATQRKLFSMELPVELDVKIKSVKLRVNSAGTTELFVRFENTGDVTIDRIDFSVKCFDTYGDPIYGYGHYSMQDNYYDSEVRPGKTTPSDWRWGLYGFDGTQQVEIAITRYHMTDGTTVSIRNKDLVWHEFD